MKMTCITTLADVASVRWVYVETLTLY